jgi:hypothetical protein
MCDGRTLTLKAPKSRSSMAVGQRFADGIQHRGHDAFDIAVIQVRIASGEPCNQF